MRLMIFGGLIAAAVATAYFVQNNDFLFSIASGVISGVVASTALLVSLSLLRPRVRIAPKIARGEMLNGKPKLTVKVINAGSADLVEPRAELHAFRRDEREVLLTKRVRLVNDRPMVISRSRKNGENVFRFVAPLEETDAMPSELYKDGLRFRIIAEHPVSGVKRVFVRRFAPEDIERGVFAPGASLSIEPKDRQEEREAERDDQ